MSMFVMTVAGGNTGKRMMESVLSVVVCLAIRFFTSAVFAAKSLSQLKMLNIVAWKKSSYGISLQGCFLPGQYRDNI